MRITSKIWVRSTFAGGILALGACNAVLGIEEAELDQAATGTGGTGAPSGGSGGSASGGTSMSPGAKAETTCDTANPVCTECVKTCSPSAVESCLADGECRNAVNSYLSCLESDCSDVTGTCIERLQDTDAGRSIALCLSNECKDECAAAGVVTVCDIYCSCMPNECESVVEVGSQAACLEACRALVSSAGVAMAVCRFDHCQIATVDPNSHCQHAVGALDNPCSRIANPPANCSQTRPGWPCSQDSECCSRNCIGMRSCG